MKEIVNLHIGQAGVQLGSSFWELFCLEHGIQPDGVMPEKHQDDKSFQTFFFENKEGKYTPRSIYFDLDPTTIDEIRSGIYRNLYHSDFLISGKEDAANLYARGHNTIGKDFVEKVLGKIRFLFEKCDNAQGFIITHSLGGGTGSGFVDLLTSRLKVEFPSKLIQTHSILPSPRLSNSVVEDYNSILGLQFLKNVDLCCFFDNESLYDICKNQLEIEMPHFRTINQMVAQVASNITSGLRFEGGLNCTLKEIQTNLIPFPNLNSLIPSYAPFRNSEKAHHEYLSISNLTNKVFHNDSLLVKADLTTGFLGAGCLLYRGDVSPKEIHSSINEVNKNLKIKFADCSLGSFKIGINYHNPISVPGSDIAKTNKSCTFLGNSSSICDVFSRISNKFEIMFSKRAFVHWFVGEGMEEFVFPETIEAISALSKEYQELFGSGENPNNEEAKADEVGNKNPEASELNKR